MVPKLHESPLVGGKAYAESYKFAPLDGTLSYRELFAFHAEHNARRSLFMYLDEGGRERHITYLDWYRGLRRASSILSRNYGRNRDFGSGAKFGRLPVIGILAVADSIRYLTLSSGIVFTGCTVFPLSPRNSPPAIAHLVKSTGMEQLYVTEDYATQALAEEVIALLDKEGIVLELLPMPSFDEMYDDSIVSDERPIRYGHIDDKSLIIHSSGSSSSFPQPIKTTTRVFLGWGSATGTRRDLCGKRMSFMSLPIFHGMGIACINWALYLGVIVALYRPCSPPIISTTENLLRTSVQGKCNIIFCVPSFIETWSHSPEDVAVLASLEYLLFAGAPLNKATGDELARKGVKLRTVYGSTETGGLSVPFSAASDEDWDYVQIAVDVLHQHVNLVPQGDGTGTVEPIVTGSTVCELPVTNSTYNGAPAFKTNDLLMPHPTRSGYYSVFGRADDQIMLSTGEKTNPLPLEQILRKDSSITEVVIFGRERPHNGVLIQPTHPFDPRDEALLVHFRDQIWPTVQKANDFAPTHSRLFKEMILVTQPDKPLLLTDKGSIRRKACLDAYATEIEAIYDAVDESSQSAIALPDIWTTDAAINFARQAVRGVTKVDISDEDDLFAYGCDSLQATWIRSTIIRAARVSAKVPQQAFPQNFVYTYPTIRQLGSFVAGIISGKESADIQTDVNKKMKDILDLLAKYDHLPFRQASVSTGSSNARVDDLSTVVLTGSTGRLGCHLLTQLVANNVVERVFALNRASNGGAEALRRRQRDALVQWNLDPAIVDSPKVSVIAYRPDAERLGLERLQYEEITSSATCFIHNAWRVDFNIGVKSFEPLVAGIRQVIDLSLACACPGGAKLLFVSSIAAFSGVPAGTVDETLLSDASSCIGNGYGESKWIAETLLSRAQEQTGLRASAIRVGQLCGDLRTGAWNTKEWVAAMVRLGQVVGALPSISGEEAITWVPVDVAATTLLEMVSSSKPTLHLVSPRASSWDAIFSSLAGALDISLRPYDDWVALLKAHESWLEAANLGSARELLAFFQSDTTQRDVRISTSEACIASLTLRGMAPVGPHEAEKWLAYWRDVGFLRT